MNEPAAATIQDRSAWGRVALAHHDFVSPPNRRASDMDALEQRVLVLERMMNTHALQLATPVDVTKLQFTTRTVVAVVIAVVGLAGAQWGLNARLEATVMNAIRAEARIQEERAAAFKASIDAVSRRQELLQYEFQRFKEEAQTGKAKR